MPTLIDNLNLINSYKSDIKSAIENKGVDMTGVSFGSYADKIGEITTTFVTETLNVTQNNTYYPSQGVDGFSQVVVNVPQSVEGFTEKQLTERKYAIYPQVLNINNSASFVGPYAFQYVDGIVTVNLPNCTSVGRRYYTDYYCFGNCYSLSSVNLPVCSYINQYAFAGCGKLSYISIPLCEILETGVFSGCQSLSYLDLPVCSYIGNSCFVQCSSITIILRSTSVCTLGYNAFWGRYGDPSIYVPYSLLNTYKVTTNWSSISSCIFPLLEELMYMSGTVIGYATSMDSTYLTTLGISSNDVISVDMPYLTSLASSTFRDCQNLVSASMPELGYIGDDTFAGCISLSEFETNVSALGDRVFENCTEFETITLNYSGVVTIGSDVFDGTALSVIYIPYGYLSAYLSDPAWNEYSSLFIERLPELSYSNGFVFGSISSINSGFIGTLGINKTSVTEVYLPDCQYVSMYTFSQCTSLTSASLAKCRYIGDWGFHNCRSLTSLTLPALEYIGGIALQYAVMLTELNLPNCGYISGAFTAGAISLRLLSIPAFCSMMPWYGNPVIVESPSLNELYLATEFYDMIPYSWVLNASEASFLKNNNGSIYVHTNLYNSYINAVGWSSLSSLFVSVGDANDVMLSYSDNMVYGSTKGLTSNFYNLLGVAINSIRVVSLPECRFIGDYALYGFTYLSGVYLGASDVCYMQNTNAIKNYVSIFVPASLVDAYKVAPNWSNRSEYIFPIPE